MVVRAFFPYPLTLRVPGGCTALRFLIRHEQRPLDPLFEVVVLTLDGVCGRENSRSFLPRPTREITPLPPPPAAVVTRRTPQRLPFNSHLLA